MNCYTGMLIGLSGIKSNRFILLTVANYRGADTGNYTFCNIHNVYFFSSYASFNQFSNSLSTSFTEESLIV